MLWHLGELIQPAFLLQKARDVFCSHVTTTKHSVSAHFQSMMDPDPVKRPSAKEILRHIFEKLHTALLRPGSKKAGGSCACATPSAAANIVYQLRWLSKSPLHSFLPTGGKYALSDQILYRYLKLSSDLM
jgi:hypothetical protein